MSLGIDAGEQSGEIFIAETQYDDADQVGAAGGKRPRKLVFDVAVFIGGSEDFFLGFGIDAATAVERAVYGADGYAADTGEIFDGDAFVLVHDCLVWIFDTQKLYHIL